MAFFALSIAERSAAVSLIATLNFRMVWQAVEKTNAALGALDGHLCPKARRIGIGTAEIADTLLDQIGSAIQTAQ